MYTVLLVNSSKEHELIKLRRNIDKQSTAHSDREVTSHM